ncbi:hydroxyacylglutathione hydrolase [Halocynthiibacter namhaensis]|uniref:hydroxyacylglutathione hydrolase n=1 Tax=Halocynthiibacter namhaensis TaxID=1290553 RepID=UPI000579223C|nr:hydroxyacylglutathione hydrolase [Halocynthiibacter namhaensis]
MSLEIVTLPALTDNYFSLIHNPQTGETTLVDAPDAKPITAALAERGWKLTQILLTHHHPDHIDGAIELQQQFGAEIVGAKADVHRLPPLDHAVSEGDSFTVAGISCSVIDVSGHTLGHIAFYMPDLNAAFTGDSLMAFGCGRLFEGDPDVMYESLQKLAALPHHTVIYSGHEYSQGNGAFAAAVDGDNPAVQARIIVNTEKRAQGHATGVSTLALELDSNPFLRCHLSALKTSADLAEDADPMQVFAAIRKRKDNF